jgi:hypothetical protein
MSRLKPESESCVGNGTNNQGGAQPVAPDLNDNNQPKKQPVSMRKVEANRRNALKSTGPRTPRGKAHSRRNAFKHGLFIRDLDELQDGEDPREFRECHKRLRDELQPVGPCEEIEVEYIAICWLRLQRLWRYENAEVEAGTTSVARDDEDGRYHPLARSCTRNTQMSLLRSAEEEAEVSGQISPELKENIFAANTSLIYLWSGFEARAEKTAQKKRHDIAIRIAEERKMPLSEAQALLVRDPKSLPERMRFVAVETVKEAISSLFGGWWNLSKSELQNEYRRQLIPDDREVDKIIRYGSAFEKQLGRAYDRLERLQRRRSGERIPPPVSVRLTQ